MTFKFGSLCGLCVLLTAGAASANNVPENHYRFSLLSDGKFEKQIEVPQSEPVTPDTPLMDHALATYAKLPFDIGERMRFLITYLGVKGGTAELLVRTPLKWNESWAHRFTGEVISADWVGWFIKLHDSIEGVTEGTQDLLPLRFYINQMEGSFRQSKVIQFMKDQKKIFQKTQRKDRPQKSDTFDFDKAQDALGALYFFRSKLASGEMKDGFEFPIFTSEKTWTARAHFVKSETKEVEGQKYAADLYEMSTHFGSSLEQKGHFKMWFTHDTRRLPVSIEADVLFGSVKVSLIQWDQGYADPHKKPLFPKIRADD